jgi:hypothetical protein
MTEKPGVWSAIAALVFGYVVGVALALPLMRAPASELAPTPEPAAP